MGFCLILTVKQLTKAKNVVNGAFAPRGLPALLLLLPSPKGDCLLRRAEEEEEDGEKAFARK